MATPEFSLELLKYTIYHYFLGYFKSISLEFDRKANGVLMCAALKSYKTYDHYFDGFQWEEIFKEGRQFDRLENLRGDIERWEKGMLGLLKTSDNI